MSLDAREVHRLEQFGARIREIARHLAAYRLELEQGGMAKAEAWALTQRLEERWMGGEFDDIEEEMKRLREERKAEES